MSGPETQMIIGLLWAIVANQKENGWQKLVYETFSAIALLTALVGFIGGRVV